MVYLVRRAPGIDSSRDHRCGNQRRSFRAMDVLERGAIWLGALGLEVDDLAADHAVYSSRTAGNLLNNFHSRFSRAMQLREHFISLSLESISCQDRDRFAENFVAGGA